MTGSIVLPLKTLLMNMLTLSAAAGALVLAFQDDRLGGLLDFRGNGGLEPSNLVLLLTIAFALSTDYGVFLLARIKEARDAGLRQPRGNRARPRAHRAPRHGRRAPLLCRGRSARHLTASSRSRSSASARRSRSRSTRAS